MADNVAITAGSGTTVRTQDKGGAHVQVVQVDVGDDTTVTPLVLGQAAAAASVPVVIASDQGALTVGSHAVTNAGTFAVQAAQSGTWTVQPGNTANTTAWKVDASSVAVPVTDNSGSLTVDNAGTFAVQATLAASATNIAKAEDVASANADVGVPAMAVQKATPANTAGTDGDYEFLQMSAGRLWISDQPSTPTIVTPADSTFSRPADTTAYAIGDLVANNTTAGSVTPLSFTGATKSGSGGTGRITRWIGQKSGSVACVIRYHFLLTSHAVTNGDNGALVFTSLDIDNYLGAFDCVFLGTAATAIGSSSAEISEGVPVGGSPIDYKLSSGDTIYVFAQAQSAFTPANAGTIGGRPVFEVLT